LDESPTKKTPILLKIDIPKGAMRLRLRPLPPLRHYAFALDAFIKLDEVIFRGQRMPTKEFETVFGPFDMAEPAANRIPAQPGKKTRKKCVLEGIRRLPLAPGFA
jgi:hypothetical protein